MAEQKPQNGLRRREFLAGAAAAAASFTIVNPRSVRGAQANSTIAFGLIGCGGRGSWIVPRFHSHGGYRLVACADYYPEHADRVGEKFGVDAGHRYTTLSAYKKLLEDKVDAVVIETPPYFHPEQAAAAVEAGKHVYLAKPIAVDVPGCNLVQESGQRATRKKLVFLVDFQIRANPHFREAARLVHTGRIGRLVCGDAHYPTGFGIGRKAPEKPEDRLRVWYTDRTISGDFIVEQSIHAIDMATWFINAAPIKCIGTGGSKGLRGVGNIWDHFNLLYYFPNDVPLTFHCAQNVHGAPAEIWCRVYGSEGTIQGDYYSHVQITGPKPYGRHEIEGLYETGTDVNIREFYEAVTQGRYDNPTVAPSVRSNLAAILGREAGYKGAEITWDELLRKNEKLELDLSGLKT